MKRVILGCLVAVLFALPVEASQTYNYPKFSTWDSNGDPLDGGCLWTYTPGTTTKKTTYSDKARTTANANPITLNSRGEFGPVYGLGTFKFVLTGPPLSGDCGDFVALADHTNPLFTGSVIWTVDNYEGQGASIMTFALLSDYGSLAAAVAAIGAAPTELWVDQDDTLTGAVVCPATLRLRWISPANIITLGAFNLTIGNVAAPIRQQVFNVNGAGRVSFSSGAIDYVYPEMFGAVADGTTDCNAAIQMAMDSYTAVKLGAGTYLTKYTFELGNRDLDFFGDGGQSVLKCASDWADGVNPRVFEMADNCAGIHLRFRDFTLNQNYSGNNGVCVSTASPAFYLGSAARTGYFASCLIDGINWVDCWWPIWASTDGVNRSEALTVTNNYVEWTLEGFVSIFGGYSEVIVSNNTIAHYGDIPIAFQGYATTSSQGQHVVVDSNTIYGADTFSLAKDPGGILVMGTHDAVISNNVIRDTIGMAIEVAVDTIGLTANDVVIEGNTILNGGYGDLGTETWAGIALWGHSGAFTESVNRVIIANNLVRNRAGDGIYVYSATDVLVTGNICTLNDANGISVSSESSNVVISNNYCADNNQVADVANMGGIKIGPNEIHDVIVQGNRCTDTQAVKTQEYGLFFILNVGAQTDPIYNVRVLGNDFQGNKTGGLYRSIATYGMTKDFTMIGNNWGDLDFGTFDATPADGIDLGVTTDTNNLVETIDPQVSVTTTDATPTDIWAYASIPTYTVIAVEAEIVGVQINNGNRAFYGAAGIFTRAGGAATLEGGALNAKWTGIESNAAWALTGSVTASPKCELQVTGAAGTTIYWSGHVKVTRIHTPAP